MSHLLQTRSLALQSPAEILSFSHFCLAWLISPPSQVLPGLITSLRRDQRVTAPSIYLTVKFYHSRSCSLSLALSTEPGTCRCLVNICRLTEFMSLKINSLEIELIILPFLKPSFSLTNRVTLHPKSWDPLYLETVATWRYPGEDPSHLSTMKQLP